MDYKYITDNNLINTQDYMYSEFLGQKFIEQYFYSRCVYSKVSEVVDITTAIKKMIYKCNLNSETYLILRDIYEQMLDKNRELPIQEIRIFQKRFEVKKRLYCSYKTSSSIANSSEEYTDIYPYLLLSAILMELYNITHSLTYFSTCLKVNDTLISCRKVMTEEQQNVLGSLIYNELNLVKDLISKKLNDKEGAL